MPDAYPTGYPQALPKPAPEDDFKLFYEALEPSTKSALKKRQTKKAILVERRKLQVFLNDKGEHVYEPTGRPFLDERQKPIFEEVPIYEQVDDIEVRDRIYKEMHSPDFTTANLSEIEMENVRDCLILDNHIQNMGESFGYNAENELVMDLSEAQDYILNIALIWANTSKSKEGFLMKMFRTQKWVQEGRSELHEFNQPEKKKGFWGFLNK